jgi:hypothetical protein
MKRPTWAIIVGILMLLFGGCGAFNKAADIVMPDMSEIINESFEEAGKNSSIQVDATIDTLGDSGILINDSLIVKDNKERVKLEDMDEKDRKSLEWFSDTIVTDEEGYVDMGSTMKNQFYISEYRSTWMRRFAYIGLFISIFFLVGGIMLLAGKKYVIPIVLTVLSLSIAANLFEIIVFAADKETGNFMGKITSIGSYLSMAVDVFLLILVMVFEKAFFNPQAIVEDYYD